MYEMFKRTKERPLIWAHRGASGYAPENTIPSFAKAIEMGADGVELDVQLTKDDVLVVIHDEWIDRTSNGKGWVKDYTLEELRQFNYNNKMEGYEHADIPTLQEVYELLKPTSLTINVEIKSGIIFYNNIEEKVLKLTREMEMEDRVLYSSFNHATCKKIHELKPDAYVGFLYADGTLEIQDYVSRHEGNALHPAIYNIQYPDYMQLAQKYNLDVNVWTVNEAEHMGLCIMAGVNAMITNYPDRAFDVLEQLKKK